jgi:hypothetical protein
MSTLHEDLHVFLLVCEAQLAEYLFKHRDVLNKSFKVKCTKYGQFIFTLSLMIYEINEHELLHYVYPSRLEDSTAISCLLNTSKNQ